MSRFDFGKISKKAFEAYNQEVSISKGIQDEVKIFNERFPKALEPLAQLHQLIQDYEDGVFTSGGVGSFNQTGTGVGGELGYVEAGEYWTNSDLTQHDLGKTTSTLTGGQLNEWISKKLAGRSSNMKNMGDSFMEAGKVSGLDPRYLVAHSAIETDWGNANGKVKINEEKHNFYGIGAFDNSPFASAYDWSNPKDGIIGGAEWIAGDYYAIGQTTLYTMRHDPTGGGHNYATDPEWHSKIASTMKGSEEFTTVSEGGAPESSGSFSGKFQNPYRSEPHTITSEFGTRGGSHKGIDIQSRKHRVNLYATAPGKIVKNETNYGKTGWGNYVVIDHGQVNGKNVYSLYAHMTDPSSHKTGSVVGPDDLIGKEGNSGSVKGVTGIHLHLEIREGSPGNWSQSVPVNPRNYINF